VKVAPAGNVISLAPQALTNVSAAEAGVDANRPALAIAAAIRTFFIATPLEVLTLRNPSATDFFMVNIPYTISARLWIHI
jgi:hypothetical protein